MRAALVAGAAAALALVALANLLGCVTVS
jgi:hypothetical protein